jgi:hypothetical protein
MRPSFPAWSWRWYVGTLHTMARSFPQDVEVLQTSKLFSVQNRPFVFAAHQNRLRSETEAMTWNTYRCRLTVDRGTNCRKRHIEAHSWRIIGGA